MNRIQVDDVQTALKDLNLYTGNIDGIHGDTTSQALVAFQFLHQLPPNGKISDKLLNLLFPDPIVDRMDINANDTPKSKAEPVAQAGRIYPRQRDVASFYGKRGKNQVTINLPYPLKLAWDLNTQVTRMSCHRKVAKSMLQIFQETLDHYGLKKIKELGLDRYGGCLNVRKIRGGTGWSMHSWGIAIDIDPARNQLRWNHKKAQLAKPEYDAFWEIVKNAGATSLGKERDYDWMHIQFARL